MVECLRAIVVISVMFFMVGTADKTYMCTKVFLKDGSYVDTFLTYNTYGYT